MLKELKAGGRTPVIPVTIGNRMRDARRSTGATQAELAEALDISRQTVWDWENDKRAPSKIAVVAWAMVTGVGSDWLLTGEERDVRSVTGSSSRFNRRSTDPHYAAPLVMKSPRFDKCVAA